MNLSVRAFHREMERLGKFHPRDFDILIHGDLKWKQFTKFINFTG